MKGLLAYLMYLELICKWFHNEFEPQATVWSEKMSWFVRNQWNRYLMIHILRRMNSTSRREDPKFAFCVGKPVFVVTGVVLLTVSKPLPDAQCCSSVSPSQSYILSLVDHSHSLIEFPTWEKMRKVSKCVQVSGNTAQKFLIFNIVGLHRRIEKIRKVGG